MNTIILTPNQFKDLSESAKNEIVSIIGLQDRTIAALREKVGRLKYNYFDYRNDIEEITFEHSDGLILKFDIWRKTAGEEWGNCSGTKIELKIGRKYCRLDIEHYATNARGWDQSIDVNLSKVHDIVDILLQAEKEENEVDVSRLQRIAASRINDIANPHF